MLEGGVGRTLEKMRDTGISAVAAKRKFGIQPQFYFELDG